MKKNIESHSSEKPSGRGHFVENLKTMANNDKEVKHNIRFYGAMLLLAAGLGVVEYKFEAIQKYIHSNDITRDTSKTINYILGNDTDTDANTDIDTDTDGDTDANTDEEIYTEEI